MRILLSSLLLVCSAQAQVIYQADFSNVATLAEHNSDTLAPTASGEVSGPNFDVSWNETPATDGSGNFIATTGSALRAEDWGGQFGFNTDIIDVSMWNTVSIDFVATFFNNSSSEFFEAGYSTFGGGTVVAVGPLSEVGTETDGSFSVAELDVSSESLLIVYFDTEFNGSSDFVQVDSITVTGVTPVPEPEVYASLAGLLALALVGWRRMRG